MTTILGLRSGGVSYLAADSRYCAGNPIPTKAEKVARAGRWAIGTSGYARTGNILQENIRVLAVIEDIGRLCRELRRMLLDDGWQKRDEDGPQALGDMALIVADESAVWFVGSDFSYHLLEEDRPWGTGSGAEYAEGSCTALLMVGWSPEDAMAQAIRIASHYDPGTDDRVQVVRLVGQEHAVGDDYSARLLGFVDASAALAAGACPQCGWRDGHRVGCIYRVERQDGQPVAFA